MRLCDLGRVAAIASLGWLIQADALAVQQADLIVVADSVVLGRAGTFAEQSTTRIQTTLADQVPDDSTFAHTLNGRTHMALIAPSFVQHAAPAGLATSAVLSSTTAQRPPSAWLMGGVTLLLLGYQLRRKHRLLRPQRFSAV